MSRWNWTAIFQYKTDCSCDDNEERDEVEEAALVDEDTDSFDWFSSWDNKLFIAIFNSDLLVVFRTVIRSERSILKLGDRKRSISLFELVSLLLSCCWCCCCWCWFEILLYYYYCNLYFYFKFLFIIFILS